MSPLPGLIHASSTPGALEVARFTTGTNKMTNASKARQMMLFRRRKVELMRVSF
jgi:hypothetical protein